MPTDDDERYCSLAWLSVSVYGKHITSVLLEFIHLLHWLVRTSGRCSSWQQPYLTFHGSGPTCVRNRLRVSSGRSSLRSTKRGHPINYILCGFLIVIVSLYSIVF